MVATTQIVDSTKMYLARDACLPFEQPYIVGPEALLPTGSVLIAWTELQGIHVRQTH